LSALRYATNNVAPEYSLDTTIPGFVSADNHCACAPPLVPMVALKTAIGDVYETKPGTYAGVTIAAPPTPVKGGG